MFEGACAVCRRDQVEEEEVEEVVVEIHGHIYKYNQVMGYGAKRQKDPN